MNKAILNTVYQDFINKNLNTDIASLLLKKHPGFSLDIKCLIEQIEAKKRCKNKLSTWFNTENIYYPNKLNIEQTSSETTAQYKAHLIKGNHLIDLTGGFGVDAFYFAQSFRHVTHCEINSELSEVVAHNYKQLGSSNIGCLNVNGIAHLMDNAEMYDCVYIDPSRRHDTKGKVFFLADCLPNVPEHIDLIFKHTTTVLVKTSPLLDLTAGLSELKFVKEIHIVAVNNEVKELLWLLEKDFSGHHSVKTINFKQDTAQRFNFTPDVQTQAQPHLSTPQTYLYEPNAAIMKSGAFDLISQKLKVSKLHKHSHLYTSDTLVDFPGRRFKIMTVLPYNKKVIKQQGLDKANITTRNFPESVQQIRKRFKIKPGGNIYAFFTTDYTNQKCAIICNKIS